MRYVCVHMHMCVHVCAHSVCLVSVPRCSNPAALALDDREIALLMDLAGDLASGGNQGAQKYAVFE